MKHKKYIIMSIAFLTVISVGVYYGLISSVSISGTVATIINKADANPDFICVKQMNNPPCVDLDNPPWTGQTRARTGRLLTAVSYVHTRTTCEPGYENVATIAGVSGASGRNGIADQPYSYGGTCTIIESDTIVPDVTPTTN